MIRGSTCCEPQQSGPGFFFVRVSGPVDHRGPSYDGVYLVCCACRSMKKATSSDDELAISIPKKRIWLWK